MVTIAIIAGSRFWGFVDRTLSWDVRVIYWSVQGARDDEAEGASMGGC